MRHAARQLAERGLPRSVPTSSSEIAHSEPDSHLNDFFQNVRRRHSSKTREKTALQHVELGLPRPVYKASQKCARVEPNSLPQRCLSISVALAQRQHMPQNCSATCGMATSTTCSKILSEICPCGARLTTSTFSFHSQPPNFNVLLDCLLRDVFMTALLSHRVPSFLHNLMRDQATDLFHLKRLPCRTCHHPTDAQHTLDGRHADQQKRLGRLPVPSIGRPPRAASGLPLSTRRHSKRALQTCVQSNALVASCSQFLSQTKVQLRYKKLGVHPFFPCGEMG